MKRSLFAAFAVTLALTAALGVVLTASAGGITFGTKTDYATETYSYFRRKPIDLVTGDFNRDGKLDLAVVNQGGGDTGNYASYPGSLLIFTGDGAGAFTRTFTFTVGAMAPMAMATADFNHDGKLDLGVAMSNTHAVNTFLGDGAGAFALAYTTTLGTLKPTALAVGDFNKDGRPDLIMGAENTTGSGNARVLLNNAAGFAVSTVTLSSNMWNPKNVAVGDFNHDGNADFVIVPDQGNLDVLQGNGAGGFSLLTSLGAGSNPIGAATSDLNADGYLDLVLGTSANVAPSYFLGRSGGIDPGSHSYGANTRPVDVAIADINGDGIPDILASTEVYVNSSWQYGFDVFAGVGDGTFGEASHVLNGARPTKFTIGDFDRDGKPDVAMANSGLGTISIVLNRTTWKSFGGFNSAVNYDTGSAFSDALSQGDFTGDGKPDLVAGQMTGQTLRHYRGSANGAFAISQTLTSLGEIKGSAAGDFNRDGRLDLALTRNDGKVQILTNTVASNLTAGPTYVVDAARLGGVAAGDLNGDGALDLVATVPGNDNANRIGVLLNKGTGVFSPTVTYTVETAPSYVALADFDGDGRLDVVVSNYVSNTVSLLLNTGAGMLGTPTTITGTNQAAGLVAQDLDRDGDIDLAVSGNSRINILRNDGTGAFPVADRKVRTGTGAQIAPLVAADINRDGILDLVAGAYQSSNYPVMVVLGVGDGTFGASTAYTGVASSARVPAVVVGDYNRDGGPDLAFVQPVSSSPFTQLSTRLSQLLEPPTITSANRATFTVGSTGIFTITATGDPTVTTWSQAGILPGSITFVTTTVGAATLAGAPAVGSGGLYTLVFTATNGVPPDATQPFTLTVQEAPSITNADAYTFTLGQFDAFTVIVGGYPTPTVALSAGALPTGVSFNPATRVISGTPAAGTIGVYPLTITATNGITPAASQVFTLTVSGPQLVVSKAAAPQSGVPIHGLVTYTLVIANQGSLTDPGVGLTDTLPAATTFARWIDQPVDAQFDGSQVTWHGAVAAGSALTVTFQVTNTVESGVIVTNSAQYAGLVQTGAVTRTFTAENACHVTGSGNWSTAFAGCTNPGAKRIIPTGFTITLDTNINLEGDLEVQGVLSANSKTVTLTGSQPQTLTGNPLTFYNLVINKTNKTDTVTIDGKLRVSKKLTITRGKLVSKSDYEEIEIETDGELELTSDITVGGSFTNTGALTTNGHAVIFDGGVEQRLVLNALTIFDDLTVYTGTTLIEAVTDDNAAVQGALVNNGVIRKGQPITTTGAYNFGLAGEYAAADIDLAVVTLGGLNALQVDRADANHPNSPAGQTTAIYWTITPTGAGYTADLILPHDNVSDATACRYATDVWECAYTAHDATTVTRSGVTAFSDWAVFASQTTTTTLSPAGPVVYGEAVTLTASVAPYTTGAVHFYSDGVALGAAQPLAAGVATLVTSTLPAGSHQITATFGGYNHYAPSLAAPITLTVGKAGAGVVVASAPAPSAFGQPVVFTATVSATPPGAGMPTGIVTFTVDAVPHTASLSGGVATYIAANLTVGLHPVTTDYGGDGNFLPAGAAVYTQTVTKAETNTVLTLTPNPAMYGAPVVYTATVGVTTGDTAILLRPPTGPTGVVRFTDPTGTVDLTGTLASGVATATGGVIPAGVYTVTATYGGDATYATSVTTATLTVNKYAVNVTLRSTANPVFVGSALSLGVRVSEFTPDGIAVAVPIAPTGTVIVTDTTGALALTGVLTDGIAVLDAPWLAAGTYTVTATYLGSNRYAASASSPLVQVVVRHGTATTLEIAPTGAFVGASLDITATVVISDPIVQGALGVTGTVDFLLNGVKVDDATLENGPVHIRAPASSAGVYTVTALYQGNDTYAGSASNGVTLTIVRRNSQTALTAAPNPSVAGDAVVFTATVTEVLPGAFALTGDAPPTPGGAVAFVENSVEVGRGEIVDGAAVFTTGGLSVGEHVITAQYLGDDAFLPSASALFTQTVQPRPVAVNDAAGTMQAAAVTILVLANDLDPAGGGLTVAAITQTPGHGVAEIAPDGQSVRYTPAADFSGLDSFVYLAQDSNGNTDDGTAAIVVTAQSVTDAPPQIALIDPAIGGEEAFSTTTGALSVDLPAGFFTATLTEKDIFFLSFTPVVTPSQPTQTPPGNYLFGNVEFNLTAYMNDAPQHGIHFATPVTVTLSYNPALLGGVQEATLELFYWSGQAWSNGGIVIVARDLTSHTITFSVSHLSQFGLFGMATPTALNPMQEPNAGNARLYLPAVMSEAWDGTPQAATMAPELSSVLNLPMIAR